MTKQSHPVQASVSDFITKRLAQSDKTQRQIAEECGFENPNVITMFKTGATKIPLNRVGAIAKALDVDPAYLLRLVLTEYLPDTWQSIEDIVKGTVLTANELQLVRLFRSATGNTDPRPVAFASTSEGVFALSVAENDCI